MEGEWASTTSIACARIQLALPCFRLIFPAHFHFRPALHIHPATTQLELFAPFWPFPNRTFYAPDSFIVLSFACMRQYNDHCFATACKLTVFGMISRGGPIVVSESQNGDPEERPISSPDNWRYRKLRFTFHLDCS